MTFAWIVKDGAGRKVTLDEAIALKPEAEFVWFHLDGRHPGALEWLEARGEIPDVARSALVAEETRPRSEPMGEGALINLRGPGATPEDDPDALVSIRIWAKHGGLVSVSFRTMGALERVCDAVKAGKVRDPGDLIAALAGNISAELDPDVAALGDALDTCELEIDAQQIYRMRRLIAGARSQAIAYRRFISPQRQALERLSALDVDWLDDDDRMHLREAADRCARMAEELEAVRERAALMHEELTDLRAEQMDTRSLLISVVALVFLPLTFLTGLFGMNVPLPFAHESMSFWWIVIGSVVISVAIGAWFMFAHWFKR